MTDMHEERLYAIIYEIAAETPGDRKNLVREILEVADAAIEHARGRN